MSDEPRAVKTASERIWLQVSDDAEHYNADFPASADDAVTWCQDSVLACEIEYMRADLYGTLLAELDALRERVRELERDAERYRWLREDATTGQVDAILLDSRALWDSMIDDAMKESAR